MAENTKKRKDAIEEELSEITPVLEKAKEAVGSIKSDNLNEIRSLKMPPEPIHDVLSAVLMLLGIEDTSWLSMKKFLGNRGVKEQILYFDAQDITDNIRRRVSKILKSRSSSFEHSTIYRVSVAAAPLAAWVKANVRYSMVLEKIQPLTEELEDAKQTLATSQDRMDACERELQEIDEKVKDLQENFKTLTREAEKLNMKLQNTELTLEKAQNLLGQLGGEQRRWKSQAKDLRSMVDSMPTRILLASAFVIYLGKAPESVREDSVRRWEEIVGMATSTFELKKLLSSESEVLVWKSQTLPSDDLSVENGIIIDQTFTLRCPFIIDPAMAATEWLQKHLATKGSKGANAVVEVVPQQDARFVNRVELAVRFGKTLIVTEIDRLEPILFPLVRRDLIHQGPRWVVQIGEKLIDYNENFRLILVTRNPDPDLPPNAASLISEINFTVTKSGLEGQLLGVTVQSEKPKLEQEKSEMLKKEEDFKVQLANLEKELLDTLASSEGNLLENQALLDSLTKTKTTAAEVTTSLEASAKASAELDMQRNQYQDLAKVGADVFFAITALKMQNRMYQFGLPSFVALFKRVLAEDVKSDSVDDRIEKFKRLLQIRALNFVGRAVFKVDRVMFAAHLAHCICPDEFHEDEWPFFVGELVQSLNTSTHKDFPDWAPKDRARAFSHFASTFKRLVAQLQLGNSEWQRWARNPECERAFPRHASSLSSFQRVLVVQTLRPDRLQSALELFCKKVFGVDTLFDPSPSVSKLSSGTEVSANVPVLMITTAGADPCKELADVAAEKVGRENYAELAMGGGQTSIALTMLRDAARLGHWLCFKNLHLVTGWIPSLEKEFNSLTPHENFRLWLTTEESASFPPILLQQSLKVTFESPPGLKKNLQRTYETWASQERSLSRSQSHLQFLLAWMHAIMQERRTYVPQGWTKAYEFSMGDLRAGSGVVELDDGSGAEPDWNSIRGLMVNYVYGGRIDNPFDLRVLDVYLAKYFNSDMLSGRGELAQNLRCPSPSQNVADYIEWIDRLDDSDSPSLFGLPSNIEKSVQRAVSALTVQKLLALGRSTLRSTKFDRSSWRSALQPLFDLWSRVTESKDVLAPPKNAPRGSGRSSGEGKSPRGEGAPSPVAYFVQTETLRAYHLVKDVDLCLGRLKRVLDGSELLTPAIMADAQVLMSGRVPDRWDRVWEGPEVPSAWIQGCVSRRRALVEWSTKSRRGSLLDGEIDLGDLFNPSTFLNAVKQQTARQSGCAMDKLKLSNAWDASGIPGAELPVTLTGLFVQGATFSRGTLGHCSADAPELVAAPSVVVAYVPNGSTSERYNSEGKSSDADSDLAMPLYENTSRQKLLLRLSVPLHNDTPSTWVAAGAALFLSS